MKESRRKIRYAVVGQGYISQVAVLPAFAHAKENSELVALVSDDPEKLRKLARKYDEPRTYTYDQYEEPIDTGAAVLLAAGIELLHAQTFSIDLQGRVLVGAYDGIDDQITASQIGVGFNWY